MEDPMDTAPPATKVTGSEDSCSGSESEHSTQDINLSNYKSEEDVDYKPPEPTDDAEADEPSLEYQEGDTESDLEIEQYTDPQLGEQVQLKYGAKIPIEMLLTRQTEVSKLSPVEEETGEDEVESGSESEHSLDDIDLENYLSEEDEDYEPPAEVVSDDSLEYTEGDTESDLEVEAVVDTHNDTHMLMQIRRTTTMTLRPMCRRKHHLPMEDVDDVESSSSSELDESVENVDLENYCSEEDQDYVPNEAKIHDQVNESLEYQEGNTESDLDVEEVMDTYDDCHLVQITEHPHHTEERRQRYLAREQLREDDAGVSTGEETVSEGETQDLLETMEAYDSEEDKDFKVPDDRASLDSFEYASGDTESEVEVEPQSFPENQHGHYIQIKDAPIVLDRDSADEKEDQERTDENQNTSKVISKEQLMEDVKKMKVNAKHMETETCEEKVDVAKPVAIRH